MKKITVVIPCKDDILVLNCVRSIDTKLADILIVFNGSQREFVDLVKKSLLNISAIKYIFLQQANLAWALETGTRRSTNDTILYMDSDCIFDQNTIPNFSKIANTNDLSNSVYKGDVIFNPGRTYIEKIIAKSRTHHTAEVLTAYKPPLMISRKIIERIGGYGFDNRLIWREDSDLDNRIRQAGINILHADKCLIYHKSITLKTDLRSTFRYGIGLAIANTLKIKLTEVPRSVLSTFYSQGLLPALYMVFRNRVYDFGYWLTILKIRFGIYKLDKKPNHESA